jgi:hypothetical protein
VVSTTLGSDRPFRPFPATLSLVRRCLGHIGLTTRSKKEKTEMPANQIAAELERCAQGIEQEVANDIEDFTKTLAADVIRPDHGFGCGFGTDFTREEN